MEENQTKQIGTAVSGLRPYFSLLNSFSSYPQQKDLKLYVHWNQYSLVEKKAS